MQKGFKKKEDYILVLKTGTDSESLRMTLTDVVSFRVHSTHWMWENSGGNFMVKARKLSICTTHTSISCLYCQHC